MKKSRKKDARGRGSTKPAHIPASGWKDILWRTKAEISTDRVSIIAAGVAFYALIAIFPAIAAVISTWALVADPLQIEQQLAALSSALPEDAAGIIKEQARKVASQTEGGISLAVIGGLLLTFYSVSKGVKHMIEGLNVAYDEDESRGFIRLNLIALGLAVALIVLGLVAIAMIAGVPVVVEFLRLPEPLATIVNLSRWPVLFIGMMAALALLYSFGPSRDPARFRWVSWGAFAATLLWLLGSLAFSLYVANFGSYNETYGSIGGVIILLTWLWLTSYIVLIGAELNAEMERQTARDTTRGEPEPLGQRGAHAADTVAGRP